MRRGRPGGLCSACGRERDDGLYWESIYVVLDFGVETTPPVEPRMEPVRCDDCEESIRERRNAGRE